MSLCIMPDKTLLAQPQLIWWGCCRSSVKGQQSQSNQGLAESSQPERTEQNIKRKRGSCHFEESK